MSFKHISVLHMGITFELKKIIIFFLFTILVSSCQTPCVHKIGNTNYYIIESDWKTYIGYRKIIDSEAMYLNVYYPHGDTNICEVLWTDVNIYICLTVGNKKVGTMFIDSINTFNTPLFLPDTFFLQNETLVGCKKLKADGVGWFGQL